MNRAHKPHKDQKSVMHASTHGHPRLGGGGQKDSHAAHFFEPWRGAGKEINDNKRGATWRWLHMARIFAFALMLGMTVSLHGSAIATQAVLHADDAALSAAMDVSPDALAYVLNKVDVGE